MILLVIRVRFSLDFNNCRADSEMNGKILNTVLITQFTLSLLVFAFIGRIDGEYDSPNIKGSSDVLCLEDGKIWQSTDDRYSWKKLGTYHFENGKYLFTFKDQDSSRTIAAYPSLSGIFITDVEKEKHGLSSNTLFSRNLFGLE